jgi:hypothetical protein
MKLKIQNYCLRFNIQKKLIEYTKKFIRINFINNPFIFFKNKKCTLKNFIEDTDCSRFFRILQKSIKLIQGNSKTNGSCGRSPDDAWAEPTSWQSHDVRAKPASFFVWGALALRVALQIIIILNKLRVFLHALALPVNIRN